MVATTLIDARNADVLIPRVVELIASCGLAGLDCETEDSERHDGLRRFCKYKADGTKADTTPLVFDMRRTKVTGFSVYPQGEDRAYYINLNHADEENRVPWEQARAIIDALPENAYWVAHNSPYEIAVFKTVYDVDFPNIFCTLQMAVSAFSPDEYPQGAFSRIDQRAMYGFRRDLSRAVIGWDGDKNNLPPAVSELMNSFCGKDSNAAHSYNGLSKSLSYGYGLKKLVKSLFGEDMVTFKQVLGGRAHTGQLTGEEIASYGADDAYWAMRVFETLIQRMIESRGGDTKLWDVYRDQENPMASVFGKLRVEGIRINTQKVLKAQRKERENAARIVRVLKQSVRKLLPFKDEPHEKLAAQDDWYRKNYLKYRAAIANWATTEIDPDDYIELGRVRGPVTNAWRAELGDRESTGPNFSHYMPIRTLMYDLLDEKLIITKGKTQSDGDARGRLRQRLTDPHAQIVIDCLNEIAGVEQRMKLYITPYQLLIDPETNRIYPTTSSMLATRRMGARDPNFMQLGKRGEASYIRGFYLPDEDDHVMMSLDWSAFELVIIGEASGDPEFLKSYGQLPHADLHGGATADILAIPEKVLFALKGAKEWADFPEKYRLNLKGEALELAKAYGYWRTEIGKGANFNYWYSGFLSTVGERMGWSMDQTGDATQRYRDRFMVAENWRLGTINFGKINGYVELWDGHRRARPEATHRWYTEFMDTMCQPGDPFEVRTFWDQCTRRIMKRANNQLVNAFVQGTNAFVAKRSIIRINREFAEQGIRGRFIMPVHDELVFSIHRDDVLKALRIVHRAMTDHPDIFKKCALDATASIGLTFEPWNPKKAPYGQIELHECQWEVPCIDKSSWGQPLNDNQIESVVEHLFDVRDNERRLAA